MDGMEKARQLASLFHSIYPKTYCTTIRCTLGARPAACTVSR